MFYCRWRGNAIKLNEFQDEMICIWVALVRHREHRIEIATNETMKVEHEMNMKLRREKKKKWIENVEQIEFASLCLAMAVSNEWVIKEEEKNEIIVIKRKFPKNCFFFRSNTFLRASWEAFLFARISNLQAGSMNRYCTLWCHKQRKFTLITIISCFFFPILETHSLSSRCLGRV